MKYILVERATGRVINSGDVIWVTPFFSKNLIPHPFAHVEYIAGHPIVKCKLDSKVYPISYDIGLKDRYQIVEVPDA